MSALARDARLGEETAMADGRVGLLLETAAWLEKTHVGSMQLPAARGGGLDDSGLLLGASGRGGGGRSMYESTTRALARSGDTRAALDPDAVTRGEIELVDADAQRELSLLLSLWQVCVCVCVVRLRVSLVCLCTANAMSSPRRLMRTLVCLFVCGCG